LFYTSSKTIRESEFALLCVVQVSTLKQQELPEIWVAAGEGCSFLEKYSYVLSKLPSEGELFNEQDLEDIKVIAGHRHVISHENCKGVHSQFSTLKSV
jgi:hypothetical protein